MSDGIARLGPGAVVLVAGASGAGKDTVLAGAMERLQSARDRIVFAQRCITRPAHPSEAFRSMTPGDFAQAQRAGAFALAWDAHGLSYGIPISADDDVAAGRTVVINASRRIVGLARQRYARCCVVIIECPPDIRAARMAARRRENAQDIAARLARTVDDFDPAGADAVIDNSGPPASAVAEFTALLLDISAAQQP